MTLLLLSFPQEKMTCEKQVLFVTQIVNVRNQEDTWVETDGIGVT